MTDEKRFHRRANFLIGAYVICLALFTGILYNAQIVNGSEYLARSTTQVTTFPARAGNFSISLDIQG